MKQTFRRVALAATLGAAVILGTTVLVRAETAGNHIDDATVTTMIKAKLLQDQSLASFQIHVDTSPTVVRLTGNVAASVNRNDADRIAKGEAGDRSVQNDLVVK